MSTLEQLKENIRIFSEPDAVAGCLSAADKEMIARVREAYGKLRSIPCTGCRYCMPCPNNVDIPGIFSLYNDGIAFDNFEQPRRAYMFTTKVGQNAAQCIECGQCEEKCPQTIAIKNELKNAHKKLAGWVE
jgi:predicted aldo/keto reductase-like oxidoreductase